jgi:hypothetical protein
MRPTGLTFTGADPSSSPSTKPGQLQATAREEELKGELARIEAELAKYAEAIAEVGPVDSLLDSRSRPERRADVPFGKNSRR